MWILNNTEVGNRLKIIREKTNLSPRKFSMKAGIDQSQYLKIEKGQLSITENVMKKLVDSYGLNQEFVLYGKIVPHDTLGEKNEFYGQPGVTLVESQADVKTYIQERREKKNHNVQQPIPVYDVDVPASKSDVTPVDDKNVSVPVEYLYVPEFSGCVAVNVYSDSMAPLLNPGSRMFIKKIDNWKDALEYGQIYIVSLNDGRRFLKYVKRSRKEETHLLLVSHNTFYEDFEIPRQLVKSVWMVDGYMNKRTQSTFQLLKK